MSTRKPPEFQPLAKPYFYSLQALVSELEQDPSKALWLELEAFENFACTLCGECCKLPWAIHVPQDYYERWNETFDKMADGRFQQPFELREEPIPTAYASFRRKPGTSECIFLEADNSCYLHSQLGEEALAHVCKVYPRVNKMMGHQYRTRYLLHSCQAVPESLIRYPELRFALCTLEQQRPLKTGGSPLLHPNRSQTYLWLGLVLDLLEQPMPESLISRWRQLRPVLDELLVIGLDQVSSGQFERLYHEALQRSAMSGFEQSDAEQQDRAMKWCFQLVPGYPGFEQWLAAIHFGKQPWPQLNPDERLLLDQYLKVFVRNRLLGVPYLDFFWGRMNLWQQALMLSLQLLCLQWLALYYRSREGTLTASHLERALNFSGSYFEQRETLLSQLKLDTLSPEDCLQAMDTALAIDFGRLQLR